MFPVQVNKGEHGYDNEEMDMKAFFRVVGPDFQKNLVTGPFETVNLYPLMCHLLGIKPEINDGHLDHTKRLLVPKNSKCCALTLFIICWLDSHFLSSQN